MNRTFPIRNSAISAIAIVLLIGAAVAVSARAADRKTVPPATVPSPAPPGGTPQPSFDPATGLPMPTPRPDWKDPDWQEPDKRLPELSYDGVPITEVSQDLRKKFDEAFDVLIPTTWHAPPGLSPVIDNLSSVPVRIQLRNVTASEVFNAMNILFETENTPLRWELRMNGKRPTAILRVWSDSMPLYRNDVSAPMRRVIYVGDLVGEEKAKPGEMTMEQLVKTMSEVYEMSYGTSAGGMSSHLQFYKPAELLIVTGPIDEINFVTETLSALRQKAQWVSKSTMSTIQPSSPGPKLEQKTNTDKPKTP